MSSLYLREHHRYGDGFYPERRPTGNQFIDVYYDQAVMDYQTGQKAIAVLLEPKSMIGDAYKYCLEHPEQFKYIFTHDSELFKLTNAKYLNWSSVWATTDSTKDRDISLVSSWKDWCPLHHARIELAKYFEDKQKVDVYGSYRNKDAWVSTEQAHEHYKFAIVIENDIDEYWYTEKILNCFSNKVIPIYVGATRIGDIFNKEGIIEVRDWKLIPEIVRTLDVDAEYAKRREAIEDNFNRVKPYVVPWRDRFMRDYEEILEELINE